MEKMGFDLLLYANTLPRFPDFKSLFLKINFSLICNDVNDLPADWSKGIFDHLLNQSNRVFEKWSNVQVYDATFL